VPPIREFAAAGLACMLAAGCASSRSTAGTDGPRPAPPVALPGDDLERRYLVGPGAASAIGMRIDFQSDVRPESGAGLRLLAAGGDSIFVLDGDNLLTRLQRGDGALLWRIPVGETVDEVQAITYVPEVNRVFLTVGGELFAIDNVNGALLARQPLDQMAATAPAVYGTFLIYGSRNGQVVWHSFEVGYQWRGYRIAPAVRLAPLLVGDAVIAIGSDGRIVALDAGSAVGIWDKRLLADVVAAPATGAGLVYIAGRDQYLWAIDARSGRSEWKYLADAPLERPPAVIADRVYQSIPGRGLACFEARPASAPGGRIVWTSPLVRGDVIGRNRDRLLAWDGASRTMTVLDAAAGGVVEAVPLPQVSLVYPEGGEGALIAAGDDGRVIRLVPR
jgi:hypothetical protein